MEIIINDSKSLPQRKVLHVEKPFLEFAYIDSLKDYVFYDRYRFHLPETVPQNLLYA